MHDARGVGIAEFHATRSSGKESIRAWSASAIGSRLQYLFGRGLFDQATIEVARAAGHQLVGVTLAYRPLRVKPVRVGPGWIEDELAPGSRPRPGGCRARAATRRVCLGLIPEMSRAQAARPARHWPTPQGSTSPCFRGSRLARSSRRATAEKRSCPRGPARRDS